MNLSGNKIRLLCNNISCGSRRPLLEFRQNMAFHMLKNDVITYLCNSTNGTCNTIPHEHRLAFGLASVFLLCTAMFFGLIANISALYKLIKHDWRSHITHLQLYVAGVIVCGILTLLQIIRVSLTFQDIPYEFQRLCYFHHFLHLNVEICTVFTTLLIALENLYNACKNSVQTSRMTCKKLTLTFSWLIMIPVTTFIIHQNKERETPISLFSADCKSDMGGNISYFVESINSYVFIFTIVLSSILYLMSIFIQWRQNAKERRKINPNRSSRICSNQVSTLTAQSHISHDPKDLQMNNLNKKSISSNSNTNNSIEDTTRTALDPGQGQLNNVSNSGNSSVDSNVLSKQNSQVLKITELTDSPTCTKISIPSLKIISGPNIPTKKVNNMSAENAFFPNDAKFISIPNPSMEKVSNMPNSPTTKVISLPCSPISKVLSNSYLSTGKESRLPGSPTISNTSNSLTRVMSLPTSPTKTISIPSSPVLIRNISPTTEPPRSPTIKIMSLPTSPTTTVISNLTEFFLECNLPGSPTVKEKKTSDENHPWITTQQKMDTAYPSNVKVISMYDSPSKHINDPWTPKVMRTNKVHDTKVTDLENDKDHDLHLSMTSSTEEQIPNLSTVPGKNTTTDSNLPGAPNTKFENVKNSSSNKVRRLSNSQVVDIAEVQQPPIVTVMINSPTDHMTNSPTDHMTNSPSSDHMTHFQNFPDNNKHSDYGDQNAQKMNTKNSKSNEGHLFNFGDNVQDVNGTIETEMKAINNNKLMISVEDQKDREYNGSECSSTDKTGSSNKSSDDTYTRKLPFKKQKKRNDSETSNGTSDNGKSSISMNSGKESDYCTHLNPLRHTRNTPGNVLTKDFNNLNNAKQFICSPRKKSKLKSKKKREKIKKQNSSDSFGAISMSSCKSDASAVSKSVNLDFPECNAIRKASFDSFLDEGLTNILEQPDAESINQEIKTPEIEVENTALENCLEIPGLGEMRLRSNTGNIHCNLLKVDEEEFRMRAQSDFTEDKHKALLEKKKFQSLRNRKLNSKSYQSDMSIHSSQYSSIFSLSTDSSYSDFQDVGVKMSRLITHNSLGSSTESIDQYDVKPLRVSNYSKNNLYCPTPNYTNRVDSSTQTDNFLYELKSNVPCNEEQNVIKTQYPIIKVIRPSIEDNNQQKGILFNNQFPIIKEGREIKNGQYVTTPPLIKLSAQNGLTNDNETHKTSSELKTAAILTTGKYYLLVLLLYGVCFLPSCILILKLDAIRTKWMLPLITITRSMEYLYSAFIPVIFLCKAQKIETLS